MHSQPQTFRTFLWHKFCISEVVVCCRFLYSHSRKDFHRHPLGVDFCSFSWIYKTQTSGTYTPAFLLWCFCAYCTLTTWWPSLTKVISCKSSMFPFFYHNSQFLELRSGNFSIWRSELKVSIFSQSFFPLI